MKTGVVNTVVTRLRDPEYTGENRCLKCTILNVLLAFVVALLVSGLSGDVVFGGVLAIFSLGMIYFRGYLIPKTPQFTKRYFPHGVLSWFGTNQRPPFETEQTSELSIESILLEAEVIRPGDEDLYLDPEFQRHWRDRIQQDRGDENFTRMLQTIGGYGEVDPEDVTVSPRGDSFVADIDGVRIGRWVSRGAFLADVAAAREMETRYTGWDSLLFDERAAVLGGLRIWLNWCPLCDGRVTLGMETVESCCRMTDVVAGSCEDCGRRLFEVDSPDEQLPR
jgi:hypothetical protein